MKEGGNVLKRNNGGLRSGRVFLKWLLPEGRLNSGGVGERERVEVVG